MNDSPEIDIYTLDPIRTITREHVFPSLLGGKIESKILIDHDTNNLLGKGIEARLSDALGTYRGYFDARGQRNRNKPHRSPALSTDSGRKVRIEQGVISGINKLDIKDLGNGRLEIYGETTDTKELRKAIRKYAKRKGYDPEQILTQLEGHYVRSEISERVNIPCELWDTPVYRAIAKIACNLFAHRHKNLFLHPAFNPIRAYVLNGRGNNPEFVSVAQLAPIQGYNLDHLVCLRSYEDRSVECGVVLFNNFSYVVRLGTLPRPERVQQTYRVDQLRASQWEDREDDLCVRLPRFSSCYHAGYFVGREIVFQQIANIMPHLRLANAVGTLRQEIAVRDVSFEEAAERMVRATLEGLRVRIVED